MKLAHDWWWSKGYYKGIGGISQACQEKSTPIWLNYDIEEKNVLKLKYYNKFLVFLEQLHNFFNTELKLVFGQALYCKQILVFNACTYVHTNVCMLFISGVVIFRYNDQIS